MSERSYDIVVWGASGFTGKLVAEYLVQQLGEFPELRLALGGRNREKLEKVRRELARINPAAADLPIVTADAMDQAEIGAVAASTKVIATTVGPYRRLGAPLVAACAREGTHYCDIAGEPQFLRAMVEIYDAQARESGARIVHCCGFDSIPSDLGVLTLQEYARAKFGAPLEKIRMVTKALRGGLSGGTAASALLLAEEMMKSKALQRQVTNPYLLVPSRDDAPKRRMRGLGVHWDAEAGKWTAPFLMALLNVQVVHRSNALLGYPYGREFQYSESMGMKRGVAGLVAALGVTGGLAASSLLGVTQAGRTLLRKILPRPGEGPSKEMRESGHFTLEFFGSGRDTKGAPVKARAVVMGTSDPGYGETRKMMGESALCLALDASKLTSTGGVLTPATAMGMTLVERLRSAGMTFEAGS